MDDRPNRLRIPITDPEAPTRPEKALPVQSVPQEYAHLARLECTCGALGRLGATKQSLLTAEGRYMDRLDVRCQACGAVYALFFDVTTLFAQYNRLLSPDEGNDSPTE